MPYRFLFNSFVLLSIRFINKTQWKLNQFILAHKYTNSFNNKKAKRRAPINLLTSLVNSFLISIVLQHFLPNKALLPKHTTEFITIFIK